MITAGSYPKWIKEIQTKKQKQEEVATKTAESLQTMMLEPIAEPERLPVRSKPRRKVIIEESESDSDDDGDKSERTPHHRARRRLQPPTTKVSERREGRYKTLKEQSDGGKLVAHGGSVAAARASRPYHYYPSRCAPGMLSVGLRYHKAATLPPHYHQPLGTPSIIVPIAPAVKACRAAMCQPSGKTAARPMKAKPITIQA